MVDVLRDLGYVRGFTLTAKGEQVRRIYGEGDLLLAEALARGAFDGLSPSELAGLVSATRRSRYRHSYRRYSVSRDHRARTCVSRSGSGFFPCQSEQNETGLAVCHSAAGCAASSLIA